MKTDKKQVPPAIILCGGKGTRLREVTELLPKPMVAIGEQPIVWHIMKTYAAFGVRRFILCLGYKRETFVNYFKDYMFHTHDVTIRSGKKAEVIFHDNLCDEEWEVTLAGTGLDAMTGCRVFRASKYLRDDDKNFFLTYGDGLCDLDMDALLQTHERNNKMITITAVHPEARFGQLLIEGDSIRGFAEKPPRGEGYINGGYMIVERSFVEKYLYDDESLILEQVPMSTAAQDGNMGVFYHEGFWQCMDNQREYNMLNAMWNSKNVPWTKYWK